MESSAAVHRRHNLIATDSAAKRAAGLLQTRPKNQAATTREHSRMSLTKEQILAADDRPTVPVETPEWGGTVYLRVISAMERDVYESEIVEGKRVNYDNIRARLLAR